MLHPRKKKIFPRYLTKLLEFYSTRHENVIILGDFVMNAFLYEHRFYNMIKQNTCFKDDGGSCIDLLITNSKFSFVRTNSLKTGLSDHHMINAILKTKFEKFEPKKSIYRNFKQYDSEQFKLDIYNSMFPMRTHGAFEKKF